MISTVTTSTVSTVTTVAIAGSLGLIGILVLFALVVQKEITSSSPSQRLEKLGQVLNIGILPLLIGFILIVATRLVAVFR
jgi:hypothetical protein